MTDTGTANLSEATSSEAVIVKELAVEVLPSTDAKDKESKTFVVKSMPRSLTTCMLSFETYLAEQLGVNGISEVGYYLRVGK